MGPRWACSITVREYWRSARADSSACRTTCSQPRRPRTPVKASARMPARTSTRTRSPLIGSVPLRASARRRASPDGRSESVVGQRGHAALVRGGQAGAVRGVLAGEAYLGAIGGHEAQLARARLDAAGRLQRGHLDLEL